MNDYFDFSGKTVVITGSTRGIGKATAELFALNGAKVLINSRKSDDVRQVVTEFQKRGFGVMGHTADIGKNEEVSRLVEATLRQAGRIDVLINNAAILDRTSLEDTQESEWDGVIQTNLKGVFHTCKAVLPAMKKQGGGNIINIVSQSIVTPREVGLHYAATKGGVMAFTKGLAMSLGVSKIRVNAVMPGMIRTDMNDDIIKRYGYRNAAGMIPLQRIGNPEEVAPACLFLASDMASYITGEILAVNGGQPSILFL